MKKLKYYPKNDALFKIMFTNHVDLLKKLVAELLGIEYNSINVFNIIDSEISPNLAGEKFCRFDINLQVNNEQIDIELQVKNDGYYPERSLYYWARAYTKELKEGDDYSLLAPTVVISILGYNLFTCEEYHSEFRVLEVNRNSQLSDMLRMHYYELLKLPVTEKEKYGLNLWLQFLNAETEEDIAKIEALEDPTMTQAIEVYRQVSVSKEFLEIERMRDKMRVTEKAALTVARNEGKKEVQADFAEKEARYQTDLADKDQVIADKDQVMVDLVAKHEAEKVKYEAEMAIMRDTISQLSKAKSDI